jgi:hypothetical protein
VEELSDELLRPSAPPLAYAPPRCHATSLCAKSQTFIYKVVDDNIPHLGLKIDTSTIKVISSPYNSPRDI